LLGETKGRGPGKHKIADDYQNKPRRVQGKPKRIKNAYQRWKARIAAEEKKVGGGENQRLITRHWTVKEIVETRSS